MGLGMAIGPFTMGDIAGNDIGYSIREGKNYLDPATRPKDLRYTDFPDKMIKEYGRIGQKVGKGWYDYDPKVGRGSPSQGAEHTEPL